MDRGRRPADNGAERGTSGGDVTLTRSAAIAVFALLCAIAASLAIGDQFAIFGIDRGVGAAGTFRAPVGQPIVPGAESSGPLTSPSLSHPLPTVRITPAGRVPAVVGQRHGLDD